MEKILAVGAVKPCCKDAENLVLLPEESRDDLAVRRCRVCGCRHRRVRAERGAFGMKTNRFK